MDVDCDSQIPDHLTRVDVDHMVVAAQSALKKLLVQQFKGHLALSGHVYRHRELIRVPGPDVGKQEIRGFNADLSLPIYYRCY